MMDEQELFTTYYKTKDVALRNRIAERYLSIAAILARKFTGRGVEYDDLYQVASLALLKGIERYDPTVGVKFSTFITPTITGEIKNYFRDHSRMVHLPRRVIELRSEVRKAAETLSAEKGSAPTTREIADYLKVSEEEVVRGMEAGAVVSLDRAADDDGKSLHELIAAADDTIEAVEDRDVIDRALKDLKPVERALLKLRFAENLSQTETAKRLNVSQMYVSRLERKLLGRLKESLKRGMAE